MTVVALNRFTVYLGLSLCGCWLHWAGGCIRHVNIVEKYLEGPWSALNEQVVAIDRALVNRFDCISIPSHILWAIII